MPFIIHAVFYSADTDVMEFALWKIATNVAERDRRRGLLWLEDSSHVTGESVLIGHTGNRSSFQIRIQ